MTDTESNSDLSAYPVITEFTAFIRRPKPLESGVTAQLFGQNGRDADAINVLGRTEHYDALVHVTVALDGEDQGGFEGYVRRPSPLVSGMVAQFFGGDGQAADMITALGLSRFLERSAQITVRLIQSADGEDKAVKKPKGPYSTQAQALWRSAFFRTEAVWRAVGTDEEFIAWIQLQPSAYSKDFSEWVDGEGRCVAAHVRRANDSGTAYKAPYSVIPLKQNEEHMLQHEQGESALGGKEWFGRQRIQYVSRWAWETLTKKLGYESMTQVPPSAVLVWAKLNQVERYLPSPYRTPPNT